MKPGYGNRPENLQVSANFRAYENITRHRSSSRFFIFTEFLYVESTSYYFILIFFTIIYFIIIVVVICLSEFINLL